MNFFNSHLNKYTVPKNMNSFWNWGFVMGMFLTFQIITGILLVVFYTPFENGAFKIIRKVSIDSNFGWFIYAYHSMGPSAYFFSMTCHMIKGLFFSSKFLSWSWVTGVIIYLLSIAVAFMGYVLPYGQMSYWGAMVIKNILDLLGRPSTLAFGSCNVGGEALQRFFLLHFTLPFVIVFFVILHIYVLHRTSSSNALIQSEANLGDRFFPAAFFSDTRFLTIALFIFGFQLGYGLVSAFQADPDNSIEADELMTPPHIVPEWYLLIFYSSLKVFPTKLTGFMAMTLLIKAILVLFESRFVSSVIANINFHRVWTQSAVIIVPLLAVLGLIGKLEVSVALTIIGLVVLFIFIIHVAKFLDSVNLRKH